MAIGKDIHDAVKRHDSVALRKMAQQAQNEKYRLFLTLLADLAERDLKTLKKAA